MKILVVIAICLLLLACSMCAKVSERKEYTLSEKTFYAAKYGNCYTLEVFLDQGISVNTANEHSQTLLHAAAQNPDFNIATILLRHGADISAIDCDGNTPLHHAIMAGYVSVTTVLLSHDANIFIQNHSGQTPLHIAAHSGSVPTVTLLLDKVNLLVSPKSWRVILTVMLKRPKRPFLNAKDENGNTPLPLAEQHGRYAIAELPRTHGALPAKNNAGQSPANLVMLRQSVSVPSRNLSSQPACSQTFIQCEDVLGIVLGMLPMPRKSLTALQKIPRGFFNMLLYPRRLARATGYLPFEQMHICPELFELLDLCEIMKDRLHLLFYPGTGKWPKTVITVQYVIDTFFSNSKISIDAKRKHFGELVSFLNDHSGFNELYYLIQHLPDDLRIYAIDSHTSLSVAYKLASVDFEVALKFFRASTSWRIASLAGILLAPINESTFEELTFMLFSSSFLPVADVLRVIIRAASTNIVKDFSNTQSSIYTRGMALLDRIGSISNLDEASHFLAASARIMYLLRIGESYSCLNPKICCLLPLFIKGLNNHTRYVTSTIGSIFSIAMYMKNYQVCHYLLQKLRIYYHYLCDIVSMTLDFSFLNNLNRIFSPIAVFSALGKMQHCKETGGSYLNTESIVNADENAVSRLVVFAHVDKEAFRASLPQLAPTLRAHGSIGCLMTCLTATVENSIPFIRIILSWLSDQHEHIVTSETLRHVLLRCKDANISPSAILAHHHIYLSWDFLTELLEHSVLIESFQYVIRDLPGNQIHFQEDCMHKLFGSEREHIEKIVGILGLPIVFDARAFSPQYAKNGELQIKIESLKSATTLQDWSTLVQESGFLSYAAILCDSVRCDRNTASLDKSHWSIDMFNPARFPAFSLLKLWHDCNMQSFIQVADWQIVMAFFAVRPDDERFPKKDSRKKYPVSLTDMIKMHFKNLSLAIASFTVSGKERFVAHVWPVIEQSCRKARCTLILDGVMLEAKECALNESGLRR